MTKPNKSRRIPLIGPVEAMMLRTINSLPEAYGASIQRHIELVSGKDIALGQIYTSLDRMSIRDFVRSYKSAPEPVRGGRSKRIYSLTDLGKQVLEDFATTQAMVSRHQPRRRDHEIKPKAATA